MFDECSSTAIFCEGDDFIRVLSPHGHEPDRDEVDMLLLRNALREEAASTTLGFQAIYESLSPRFPYGASIITFEEARRIMRRTRDNRIPPVPLNLNHMNSLLQNPIWKAWTLAECTRDDKFFLRKVSIGGDALIFRSQHGMSRMGREDVSLFIGFLKARPLQSVLAVGLFEETDGHPCKIIPLAYILMEEPNCLCLLNVLRAVAGECTVGGRIHASNVLCHSHSAVRTTVATVWPTATVTSSVYLLCEELYEKVPINLEARDRNFTIFRKLLD